MVPPPPRSTATGTLCPYEALFRARPGATRDAMRLDLYPQVLRPPGTRRTYPSRESRRGGRGGGRWRDRRCRTDLTMRPFVRLAGIAAPLLKANIDTDMIIRVEHMTARDRKSTRLNSSH